MTLDELAAHAAAILDEIERVVVGKRDALQLVLTGMLADGHVLLEDFPGLAKTLIARSFAQVATMEFRRIQFTPDLMPADVTGSSIFDQRISDFEFRPGPIFTNLLLADEINRAPPKTQAALLEAMQERQVTIEGITRPLARPFLVLDRVLRGEHEERPGQRSRDPFDRHLALLHRLQQRRLRLRWGAVDLVGEEEVGEDRARPELEVGDPLVEDRGAGDVGRHQVGGELDALERQRQDARDGADQEGLGQTWDADEKTMTAAEQGHE